MRLDNLNPFEMEKSGIEKRLDFCARFGEMGFCGKWCAQHLNGLEIGLVMLQLGILFNSVQTASSRQEIQFKNCNFNFWAFEWFRNWFGDATVRYFLQYCSKCNKKA